MNFLKSGLLSLLALLLVFKIQAQAIWTLTYQECENRFLNENLQLLAAHFEISISKATALQAGLWPNPNLTIDNLNFWATPHQIEVGGESLPSIGSTNFGKYQQVSVGIEQLILTAGKRKKLKAVETVNIAKSEQGFLELLRHLKFELRSQLTELQYLQHKKKIYVDLNVTTESLVQAYKNQVASGNISKNEYIRLKALSIQLNKEIYEIDMSINQSQKELNVLLHLPVGSKLEIVEDHPYDFSKMRSISLEQLLVLFDRHRPDLKLLDLESDYFARQYIYEKAQKIPNLTLLGNYDRGGNLLYNFIGFGIGIDLPIWDRNQGNIRKVQWQQQQAKLLFQDKKHIVQNEINLAYSDWWTSLLFYENIDADYEQSLDEILMAYQKNFKNRNISMLEYMDFVSTYIENKQILLEAQKKIKMKWEELNFTVGTEILD